jgi:hypothetical protein
MTQSSGVRSAQKIYSTYAIEGSHKIKKYLQSVE